MPDTPTTVAFIDFGEAARAFADSLVDGPPLRLRAYDILLHGSEAADAAQEALAAGYGASLAPHVVFDINSVSVGVKQANAGVVRGAGGAYVDMAVMAPVHLLGHRTPVLVACDLEGTPDAARLSVRGTGRRAGTDRRRQDDAQPVRQGA